MSPAPVSSTTPIAGVVADVPEGVDELAHGLGSERVAHVLAVDGDLGDTGARVLVADVFVLVGDGPVGGHVRSSGCGVAGCQEVVGEAKEGLGSLEMWRVAGVIDDLETGSGDRRSRRSVPAPGPPRRGHRPGPAWAGQISARRSWSGAMAPCPAPRNEAARPDVEWRRRSARWRACTAGGSAAWLANMGMASQRATNASTPWRSMSSARRSSAARRRARWSGGRRCPAMGSPAPAAPTAWGCSRASTRARRAPME